MDLVGREDSQAYAQQMLQQRTVQHVEWDKGSGIARPGWSIPIVSQLF